MPDKPNRHHEQNATENKTDVPAQSGEPASIEPMEACVAAPVERQNEENAEKDHDKANRQPSKAEQALVDRIKASDRWMIGLTGLIAIGGIVSAVIFGYQLHEMKITAELTRESIKVARQTMTASQRAFLFVDSYDWRPIEGRSGWGITINIENSGNTPVKNLTIDLSCPQGTEMVDDPLTSPKLEGPTAHLKRVLGPKQKATGGTCIFPMSSMVDFQKKGWVLYIVMQASYEDIFGEKHRTEFCDAIFGLGGNLRTAETLSTTSTPCRTHNCSDEECEDTGG